MFEEPEMVPTISEAEDSIKSGFDDDKSAAFEDFSLD